jgi:hypothetical protein
MFNMGYIFSDFKYLILVPPDEPNYYYRTGFAIADTYMRFFYRTTYSAPLGLKAQ